MADANITLVCPSHGKLLSSVERCHTRKDILSAHPEDSGGGSPLLFTVWPSSRRPRPVSYALCFNHPQDPSPPYHGNTERTPLHGFVTIRHPGYDRVLFIFPAHDLVPEAQLVVPPRSSVSAKLASSLEPAGSSGSTSLPAAASEQDAQRESLSSTFGAGRHISSSRLGRLPNYYEQSKRISSHRHRWPCPRSRLRCDLDEWHALPPPHDPICSIQDRGRLRCMGVPTVASPSLDKHLMSPTSRKVNVSQSVSYISDKHP